MFRRVSISLRSRFVQFIALALTVMVWAVSCAPQANNNANNATAQPLTVSTNTWIGYSGQHVAQKKGFYKEAGLNIQDTMFPSNAEQITAFLAGRTDIAWLTSADSIQMTAKDPSIRMIFLIDYSNGSDGILGRNIKSPSDLRGKAVARENVLFERVLLQAYLDKGGLTEQDLQIKDLLAPDAANAFAAKQVDAAVTYEPYLTKAAKEGGGEVIFSTKGTNLIADVIITRQSIIQNRRNDLLMYLKAADRGIKLLKANDEEALKLAAGQLGIKPEELKEQLKGATLFDLEGNKSIGFNLSNPNNAIKNFELTAKAAVDFKFVPQALDIKNLYDDSLVKAL